MSFSTAEILSLPLGRERTFPICAVCCSYRFIEHPAICWSVCGRCYDDARDALGTIGTKMLLTRALPLPPELAAVIISMI
jgi:hypothetical protein